MPNNSTVKALFPRAARKKDAEREALNTLGNAAALAAEEILHLFEDEAQFTRYVYTEKSGGPPQEIRLGTHNVKQLREAIAAIRELAETARLVKGDIPPETQANLDLQMKKLAMEEKKILPVEDAQNTGVVLLPKPEEAE